MIGGERVQHIAIVHESMNYSDYVNNDGKMDFEKLKRADASIGVDSGQAGFFRDEDFGRTNENEAWYDAACDCTLKTTPPEQEWDVRKDVDLMQAVGKAAETHGKDSIQHRNAVKAYHKYKALTDHTQTRTAGKFTFQGKDQGFNASSGFGDGGYQLGVHEVDDQIVAMFIPFTYGPEEEEE